MTMHATLWSILLSLGLCAVSPDGRAHGEAGHGGVSTKKEQKPWGIAGDTKAAKRVVEVRMTDNMRFFPDSIEVRRGESVRVVVRNDGRMMHELVLGTKKSLDEHAVLMAKSPGMTHDAPDMTHVAPGKSGEIVWHFNRAGIFLFACLIPGHYQAGMIGKITVAAN